MYRDHRAPAFGLAILLSAIVVCDAYAGSADQQEFTVIERGRYLSTLSDCGGCHTVPGGKPFAGGRPIETPFGNIVSPNITPDLETGIGAWSDKQFDDALRRGIGWTGMHLYPAMPYNAYSRMSSDDVLAIRAYLGSLEPVRQSRNPNTLPFPFNVRSLMAVWNKLYFTAAEYEADPAKSEEWNRGKFIVDGPAHCGACHAPKTILGGDQKDKYLQGANLQGWSAPDITNDPRTGLGSWTAEDVVLYLKTGHNRFSAATGPMAEAVELSTSKMTDADTMAIANYLKSLPGKGSEGRAPSSADGDMMTAGKAIYRDQCSACHGIEGKGVAYLFPSLGASAIARSDDPTTVIRILLRGARSVSTKAEPTAPGMPSYGGQLDDHQIAAVLNYVRNSWGSASPAIEAKDVTRVRSQVTSRAD
ncbi:alcohol dehydrogenase [Bradyrhizobium canariense]|uniref:c-type cytochrome n=1 Tax=Bradyrhizobium canariense TaxID=255045 RepID=UPI000A1915B4|nr:cytochrome c [Bradyrhizobium canariense]OSI65559.1 alcohol dehydrogenase [Bradyrhizobium canariense]